MSHYDTKRQTLAMAPLWSGLIITPIWILGLCYALLWGVGLA